MIKNLIIFLFGMLFGVVVVLAFLPGKRLSAFGTENVSSTNLNDVKNLVSPSPGSPKTETADVVKAATPSLPLPTTYPQDSTTCAIDANDGSISKLPVLQLTNLISLLIPAGGVQGLSWDYLSDQKYLLWKTSGIGISETGMSCRQALARVRVGDIESKFLAQQWTELPWTVSLYSDGNVNFGPTRIELAPGSTEGSSSCFGVGFEGCTFDPNQVLKSPLFTVSRICSSVTPGSITDAFVVNAPSKAPTLLVYNESGGSGGSSSWFDIRPLSDTAGICKTE